MIWDYLLTDNKIQNNESEDITRLTIINYIKLESIFFNLFRNLIKTNLSKNEFYRNREDIYNTVNNNDDTNIYNDKLEKIRQNLLIILENKVEFKDYKSDKDFVKKLEKNLVNKINCSNNFCDKDFCNMINDECITVFPKVNLVNDDDNENNYYYRIADEILRYKLINDYIMKPNTFMYASTINYNINDDELLLLQSSLNQEYFEELSEVKKSIFSDYNVYENTNTIKTKQLK